MGTRLTSTRTILRLEYGRRSRPQDVRDAESDPADHGQRHQACPDKDLLEDHRISRREGAAGASASSAAAKREKWARSTRCSSFRDDGIVTTWNCKAAASEFRVKYAKVLAGAWFPRPERGLRNSGGAGARGGSARR